jgi:hypothetical protein
MEHNFLILDVEHNSSINHSKIKVMKQIHKNGLGENKD